MVVEYFLFREKGFFAVRKVNDSSMVFLELLVESRQAFGEVLSESQRLGFVRFAGKFLQSLTETRYRGLCDASSSSKRRNRSTFSFRHVDHTLGT